ncbi:MAG: hypothetical protein U9R72_11255 [Chloroflexota bacterium]|nr:hypothetical protein [Chloroflexota bacterium]
MTKRSGDRERAKPKAEAQAETSTAFQRVPLWGWALIFLVPLIASEFMFWNVGKIPSMIIFPIAWIGFWYAMMERSGWPILRNRGERGESHSDEDE